MAQLSQYQRWLQNNDYATTNLTLQQALYRARMLEHKGIDYDGNDERRPRNYRIMAGASNANQYTVYDVDSMGYAPGATEVRCPAPVADPAPRLDQHQHTSSHMYDREFSSSDLPNIMFRLEPYRDNFTMLTQNGHDVKEIPVPMLCYPNGAQVVTRRGAKLRYFKFLPRYISNKIDGALLDFWSRLDPRLEMNDIVMRMESEPGGWRGLPNQKNPKRNKLRMRRDRTFKVVVKLGHWGDSRLFPSRAQATLVDDLDPYQICLNTTMVVDLENGRLLKPVYDDIHCERLRCYRDSGLPMDYFLRNVEDSAIPSLRMLATISLRERLQQLAIAMGLGTEVRAYRYLQTRDEPPWWNDKEKDTVQGDGRRIDEIDALSHKEWIRVVYGTDTRGSWKERQNTRGAQL